jgi:arylamine N-acetyltransferase
MPMIDGYVIQNIGTQELRLVYDNIPGQINTSEKFWIYQYRNQAHLPWNSFYCFPGLEFRGPDFEVMNYFTSSSPKSFQTYRMVIVKFLRRENEDEIYGKAMLIDGVVKLNTGGRTSVAKVCKTEQERIEALKEYFGITLTEEQKEGIRGRVTELGQPHID